MLKIEVGKTYRTLGGWKASVVQLYDGDWLVRHGVDEIGQARWHDREGGHNGGEKPYDLVAPWPDKIPEGFEDTGEHRCPKEGEWYLNEDGSEADLRGSFCWPHETYTGYCYGLARHILRRAGSAGEGATPTVETRPAPAPIDRDAEFWRRHHEGQLARLNVKYKERPAPEDGSERVPNDIPEDTIHLLGCVEVGEQLEGVLFRVMLADYDLARKCELFEQIKAGLIFRIERARRAAEREERAARRRALEDLR